MRARILFLCPARTAARRHEAVLCLHSPKTERQAVKPNQEAPKVRMHRPGEERRGRWLFRAALGISKVRALTAVLSNAFVVGFGSF